MSKPRIIIVDTDINYIMPLQLKFIRDFFEKIDLEVITDPAYFDQLFQKPQNADILIISEDLYSVSIQKHNISNVFIMTEQPNDVSTGDLNAKRLFKYSSIKEIFNEIISNCYSILNVTGFEKKDTQIIAITSAVGGVGKTTVAMGVCACLTKNYKRVLYINASRLHVFQYMFENSTPITNQDIYTKMINPTEQIYDEIKHTIRYEQFSYLPPFKAALLSLGIHESIFEKIVKSAQRSKEYDFIVVDMESSFSESSIKLINMADKVIVITDQSRSSVLSTNVYISNINGVNSEKYIFVCNKFNKDAYNSFVVPDMNLKFAINEFIEYYDAFGNITCAELSEKTDIRKIGFLII